MGGQSDAITVSGLRKSFDGQTVLAGVEFSVKQGEIFALLGSNGAGKTTTIRILTTLAKADSGTARVCGFDVAKQARNAREVFSLTGQSVAVDDILTGRENLVMIGRLRHLSNPKALADKQLAAFGLTEAANKPLSQYSGGMRRRLDLAMSMLGKPRVVFLDEPTTGLDPQSRLAVWDTIREMARSGVTIFLTTQYLEEAEQLAEHIAILHGGKIIAYGTLAQLRKRFPPAKAEYIIKQPTLEEVFLAIIGEGAAR
ncbi:MAG: ATP-binding cassette domain-containing protein [Gracilibacteraceae bacterium]|jgi:ABC-2 type transport system ATP-binding protein|nr:ATP-binding cassette domain-containing protein [Gracilibacteraceae bacterium]